MQVIFERVDERRYLIGAVRDGRHDVGADVPVRPGPGSADVPHDLVHFVVEEQAGLTLGIYGQLALGADVGGFFRTAQEHRSLARDHRRSTRLGRAGRDQVAESERLASLARTGRVTAVADLDPALARALDQRLGEVLALWRAVPHGGRLTLTWPDRLTARADVGSRPQDRRRRARSG